MVFKSSNGPRRQGHDEKMMSSLLRDDATSSPERGKKLAAAIFAGLGIAAGTISLYNALSTNMPETPHPIVVVSRKAIAEVKSNAIHPGEQYARRNGMRLFFTNGGNTLSSFWAGYAAHPKGDVTGVNATFTVPAVSYGGRPSGALLAVSEWVGIGGYMNPSGLHPGGLAKEASSDTTLIQAGVLECGNDGHFAYAAWYQLLPGVPQLMQVSPRPGDKINVNIHLVKGGADRWKITVSDLTNGVKKSAVVFYNSSMLTGDFIEETPLFNNSTMIPRLPDVGNVYFKNATVSTGGKVSPLGALQHSKITMYRELSTGRTGYRVHYNPLIEPLPLHHDTKLEGTPAGFGHFSSGVSAIWRPAGSSFTLKYNPDKSRELTARILGFFGDK